MRAATKFFLCSSKEAMSQCEQSMSRLKGQGMPHEGQNEKVGASRVAEET